MQPQRRADVWAAASQDVERGPSSAPHTHPAPERAAAASSAGGDSGAVQPQRQAGVRSAALQDVQQGPASAPRPQRAAERETAARGAGNGSGAPQPPSQADVWAAAAADDQRPAFDAVDMPFDEPGVVPAKKSSKNDDNDLLQQLEGSELSVSLDAELLLPERANPAVAALELPTLSGGDVPCSVPWPRSGQRPTGDHVKLNVAVLGSLQLGYARRGQWHEAVAVIGRARALGIMPNTHLYNMAMYAAAKRGQFFVVAALLRSVPKANRLVGYETLMYGLGLCGEYRLAEQTFDEILSEAHKLPQIRLRDYTIVALITAYNEAGLWREALAVRGRMAALGAPFTGHVLNALLTVCVRHRRYQTGIELLKVRASSVVHNQQLLVRAHCCRLLHTMPCVQRAPADLRAAHVGQLGLQQRCV